MYRAFSFKSLPPTKIKKFLVFLFNSVRRVDQSTYEGCVQSIIVGKNSIRKRFIFKLIEFYNKKKKTTEKFIAPTLTITV